MMSMGILVLMIILKEIFLSFSLLTIMFAVVLQFLAFIMLRYVPSMTTLAEFSSFIKNSEFKFEFCAA